MTEKYGLYMGNAPQNRTHQLQQWLVDNGYTGFLIPRTDEFQGEYLPPYAERLWWLTGFSGSAGQAIVSPVRDKTAIFTDGRYTIQVEQQINPHLYTVVSTEDTLPQDWIASTYTMGDTIAYDPWLFTPTQLAQYQAVCETHGIHWVAVDKNPIDILWDDQPAPPIGDIRVHPSVVAGQTHTEKLANVADALIHHKADYTIMTMSCAIAWLFNIRGMDIAFNPVVLSYAVVHKDASATLYVDAKKMSDTIRNHLGDTVHIRPMDDFMDAIKTLQGTIALDKTFVPCALVDSLTHAPLWWQDYAYMQKSQKNPWEQDAMRHCHVRDGVAMCRMLHWIDTTPYSQQDEWTNAQKLYDFRSQVGEFRDVSFDTISGVGANGAIAHYRVSTESAVSFVDKNTTYVLDSGSQYTDGTTDITRTVCIGTPTAEHKHMYTLVLKGFIAVHRTQFLPTTTPAQLDGIARQFLWGEGYNFEHGTGHGVGCALNVHEGPIRIAPHNTAHFKSGMILSIEPGYYKRDDFGIRIENLAIAQPTGNGDWMRWENITWCPIDTRLVDIYGLTETERDWLNDYHNMVWKKLSPFLDNDGDRAVYTWLMDACEPL